MPFSHHSHSGQFCRHAKNTLEEMVQAAISKRMQSFALTEHMPRDESVDLYPEEVEANESPETLAETFDSFFLEAERLREKYRDQISILVGFESDWIRSEYGDLIKGLRSKYRFDFQVGSVHHVHAIPIDFDHETYAKAKESCGNTEETLFEEYFNEQFEMLQVLRPEVVGHFDLIRLLSSNPDQSFKQFKTVWSQIERNLEFVSSYGGLLELNSSALRKGLKQPYPNSEICQAFAARGGRFCLSDDSHAIGQVGLNYGKVIDYAQHVGIEEIYYMKRKENGNVYPCEMKMAQIKTHAFFS